MLTRQRHFIVLCAIPCTLLVSAVCFAQAPPVQAPAPQVAEPTQIQPTAPQPAQAPPAPPSANPPPLQGGQVVMPPQAASTPASAADPSGGQWVFTNQYGWVWVPYAQNYTYVNGDGSAAYEYAYYPSVGWTWLYSPWVLGWGPRPYWGYLGAARFGWYAHPWFRAGVAPRAAFVGPARGYRGGYVGHGVYVGGGYRGGYGGGGYHGGGGGHGGGHR